jgi:sigma-E factor negative regulatory protein RseB
MRNNVRKPQHKRRLLSASLFLAMSFLSPMMVRAETKEGAFWLDRFARMDELNFRGVLIYARGDHQESLRVTHGVYNGERYERLEHLDGERREVIRLGDQLTCIQLGQRLDRLLHRHVLKAGLVNLDPYYAIRTGEEIRIANRRAITLSVKARDEFRYSYRMAVDYDTGLLLRFESLNQAGHALERLQFVDVQIGEPLKKEWLGDIADTGKAAPDPTPIERVVEEAQMAWKPRWLPPGFALAVAPHRSADNVLTYSDGLAAFSVFVEAATEPLPSRQGSAEQGATVAYTRPVQIEGKPHLILVVGEVPTETAKRVANSVEWNASAASR